MLKWITPSQGEFKLNTDLQDRLQEVERKKSRRNNGYKFYNECTSFVAEVKALLRGLLLCKQRNIKPIQVEVDSLSLANIVQKKGIRYWDVICLL